MSVAKPARRWNSGSRVARRRVRPVIVVWLACTLTAACSSSVEAERTLKLAHSLNRDHPVHHAIEHLGVRLGELSGGQLQLEIFPNSQLGSEREMIELLQIGSVAMTKVSTLSMEGFAPEMKLFSVPYLFADNEHFWRVLESPVGRDLLTGLRAVRLQGLGYYDAGSRSFYLSDSAVRTPADLVSRKIRVLPSRTSVDMVEALGGSATPIAWGELYTALQQGVVDGAENNPPSYYLSRHFETAPYYSLDEHTSVPDILIISRRIYDDLSPQEHVWLQQAVTESVVFQRALWQEATTEALEQVIAAGVTVSYPDKGPFRDAVAPIRASYDGTPVGRLIRAVEALELTP